MTNFDFLPDSLSFLKESAVKAESHIHGDPRAACFGAAFLFVPANWHAYCKYIQITAS